ncbi:MAG: nucleoside-diphosphate sugar epimerase/dehydratase [Tissierellia bacterium]|nr:nucleoside-diphosphate sugar epimerase/dehydratase [Tissierellia bacterium]
MKITRQNVKYVILDMIIIFASLYLALILRFGNSIPSRYYDAFYKVIPFLLIFKILSYTYMGLYTVYWKNASVNEAFKLSYLVLGTSLLLWAFFLFFRYLPLSVFFISISMEIIFTGLIRFVERYKFGPSFSNKDNKDDKRILIVGAGDAGLLVLNEIARHDNEYGRVVSFVDDDLQKKNVTIKGVSVDGTTDEIERVVKEKKINSIIFAIPSVSMKKRAEILGKVKHLNINVKVLPSLYEIINGKFDISSVRDVSIDDLLGRDQIVLNSESLRTMIKDRTILVTGGGGSIGSELCRQIAKYDPKKLVILDIYENNAYDIQLELLRKYPQMNLEVCIESIRDRARLRYVFDHYRPDLVFHAAAHKHVPLMEDSYISAIKNNVFGTKNLLELADEFKVKKFVNISTDKAVNPTNIMGATKRIIEIMLQTINAKSQTDYVAVRFGNVLGSNGSVIPLFKKQISEGGPVTVTHKDIIRYFMTIPEACQLVLQAGAIAKGGEIFILDMGEPVKILDLAENLIRLSGFVPYEDISIEFTGLRPGEKLFEELLLDLEKSDKTEFDKIFVEKARVHDEVQLKKSLDKLHTLVNDGAKDDVIAAIKELVPEFDHREND